MSWIETAVIYHMYPLGFCGAPEQNPLDGVVTNRIKKVADWIPHLKNLGVNCIYIGPVFSSTAHGYDTADYRKLDERLGSNEDFKALCRQLHSNGIRIVLDGVFNHVGRDFWAFRDLLEKREHSPYKDWFANVHFGGNTPYNDGFGYESWHGFYNLVKLNLHNPAVEDHLLGAVAQWMDEYQIDGLRLDAADCVDDNFFRKLRSFTKEKNPDFWLMGEIIHGDYNRWANDSMLDSVTNYECHKGIYSSHNDKNYFEIAHSLNRQFAQGGIYQHLRLYSFVDNHDVNRLASMLKEPRHLPLCYALMFGMPGVPSIYYGSEWGIQGEKSNGSDAPLRPCVELSDIPADGKPLMDWIGKLSVLRENSAPLQNGSYESALIRNEQFVFARFLGEQRVCFALNLAEHPQYVEFPGKASHYTDVLTGDTFESNDGNFKLELPAFGVRILCTPAANPDVLREKLNNCSTNASGAASKGISRPSASGGSRRPAASAPSIPVAVAPPSVSAGASRPVPAHKTEAVAEIFSPSRPPAPPVLPEPISHVHPGKYLHFKGNYYNVVGIAKHTETSQAFVVYHPVDNPSSLWIRSFENFCEVIVRDGEALRRFTPVD